MCVRRVHVLDMLNEMSVEKMYIGAAHTCLRGWKDSLEINAVFSKNDTYISIHVVHRHVRHDV